MLRHFSGLWKSVRVCRAARHTVESLEGRLLLSNVTWTGSGDGTSWTNAANWSSNPSLPGASDDVTIPAAAGTIHLASGNQSIHSLTSGEAVSFDGGTLTIGTSAQMSAPAILNGGGVSGGTWTFSGTASQFNVTAADSTINGLTVNGTMDLSQVANANMTVLGGLVLNGSMVVGNASGSTYGRVFFGDTSVAPAGSLTGTGSVVFGGTTNNFLYNDSNAAGAPGTLTIGSGIIIHGKSGQISSIYANSSLANQGTISADVSGGTLTVNCGALTNSGTLSAANSGALDVHGLAGNANTVSLAGTGSTLTLSGTNYTLNSPLTVVAGQTLSLTGNPWANASTLTLTDGTLNLGGSFTQAALGTFHRSGGTVNLTGSISGGISLDASTGSWNLANGTINGGTINQSGGSSLAFTATGGTLSNGVTANGVLDLSQVSNANVTVLGGMVLNGTMLLGNASGSTYGHVLFGDASSAPAGSLTGSGSVVFGGSSADIIYNYSNASGATGTLTIGPGITIHGKTGQISSIYANSSLANQGTISADVSGGTLTVNCGALTNSGGLSVANGSTLDVHGLTGNAGTITLSGSGSTLTLSGTNYTLNSPVTVAAGQTLSLTGNPWANASTLTLTDGTLNLGGSFTQAALGTFHRNGGTVNLTGTVNGGLSLDASTGSWNLSNGTINGGTINQSGGSVLAFTGSGGTFSNGVTANGVLDLSQVSNANVTVLGGMVLNGTMLIGNASGSTYGHVLFGDASAAAAGSLTGTGSVVFGGSTANVIYNYSNASGATGTLTIGPGITIHGKTGQISSIYANASLANQGIISADVSGGTITLQCGPMTNSGTLSAANGGTLDVHGLSGNAGTLSLSGTGSALTLGGASYTLNAPVTIATGQTLSLNGTPWNNASTITLTDGTLNLGGSFTQSGLGTLNRSGGTVNLTGSISGGLSLDALTGSWNLMRGTVSGGTLSQSGGSILAFTSAGGTLSNGVTANGVLDLSQVGNANVTILGGLVLNGTMLVGNASGSTYGNVFFGDTSTAPAGSVTGSGSIVFGGSGSNYIYNYSRASDAAATLTIGPGITLHGKNGQVSSIYSGESLSNQGTISADVSGGTIALNCGPVTNTGTLSASNGGILDLENAVTDSGTMSFQSGGRFTGSASLTVNSRPLTFSSNSTPVTSTLGALTLNGTAVIDLANNVLQIIYGAHADPFTTIKSYVNGGAIITSSGDASHALAIGDTAIAPIPGASQAVVLRLDRRGDANLDGTVNFADLLLLAQNYGRSLGNSSWQQGDFTNDGNVQFNDLLILAQNYGQSASAAEVAGSLAAVRRSNLFGRPALRPR